MPKTPPDVAAAAEARVAARELATDEARAEARRQKTRERAREGKRYAAAAVPVRGPLARPICADCRDPRADAQVGTPRGYICGPCARKSLKKPADLSPKPRQRGRVPGPELDPAAQDQIAAMRGSLTSARAALQLAQSHNRESVDPRANRGDTYRLAAICNAARRCNDAASYLTDARRAAKKLHAVIYGARP